MGFDLDTNDRPNVGYGDVAIHVLLRQHGTWRSTQVASNGRPMWLVMRRPRNGGAVIAWTRGTGIFIARR